MQKIVLLQQDLDPANSDGGGNQYNLVLLKDVPSESDDEQEKIADSNSSLEKSDDGFETNDDKKQCNYIALDCLWVVCVVQCMQKHNNKRQNEFGNVIIFISLGHFLQVFEPPGNSNIVKQLSCFKFKKLLALKHKVLWSAL